MALMLAVPAQAVDSARLDAFLEVARAQGCVIHDLDATLREEGFADRAEVNAIVGKLEAQRKASRLGPALLVRSDACRRGDGPTGRERLLAVLGQAEDCAQPLDRLYHKVEAHGLTRAQADLLRAEMEGRGELVAGDDGATLRLAAAQCADARQLAASITPHPEQAFLAFIASHGCRMGRRDHDGAVAEAGLDPAATDIVIEKLVSQGQAIYYGPDESLIVFEEHCK
ncbi:hypothetical protein D6850_09075 [Roseovarius spongiae]|uniref:Uncharacterized protein n=1 Tax=Roseovarius spongiae TaxID=2320272 RepID=A0A3A8AXW6_9RHOB|nr:hypothetical protein [Roseovarius spongiae]RKF15001.1 hypothetical protein D6850_09075 [Roseovarius spongiae]